jgi:DNA-binding winged helix-turn-helix (wHTH) protein/tetratricopeptide (TPR) repeat protein
MHYRWGDYRLDREGTLLTHGGQQIDVSRKVLDCISHLVEHRHRVVGYDELIRKIWGHDSVTNNQLSQVVLAARRALGDDGHAQHLIRTMPGLGYRWVGEVIEGNSVGTLAPTSAQRFEDDHDAASAAASDAALAPTPDPVASVAAIRASARWHPRMLALGLFFLLCAGAYLVLARLDGGDPPAEAPAEPTDPIAALSDALHAGNFEQVREGLATLPPHLADTQNARILAIQLDIRRARFNQALEKLERQLSQPEAAADPIFRARLLILKTTISVRMEEPPQDSLALAQSAVAALDASQKPVPLGIRAEAHERRAAALLENDRLDDALRDLALAADLFERSGGNARAIDVKTNLARAWMRMGRLQDALNASREAAGAYRDLPDRVLEIFARNTMSRIQMELLQWDDALASNDRSMQLLREVPDAERRYRTLQLRAQIMTAKGQLRLAAAYLEEADGLQHETEDFVIPAFYRLESTDPADALRTAAQAFERTPAGDETDILLDSKDGALLLWIGAAQKLARTTGTAMPAPSPEQQQRLLSPKTALARIARGRWLWSQGQRREAEAELRRALDESRRMNQFFRMTLAAEPLVEMLLQGGDAAAARSVMTDLRAYDTERMDGDYRVNLLRLRVALAMDDKPGAETAYRNVRKLAGERRLPADLAAGGDSK